MSTINGKTLSALLEAIRKPSDEKKKQKTKYSYWPIWVYEDRLKNVLGLDHYRIRYSELKDIHFQTTGQSAFSTTCFIEFIDDNGDIAYTVNGIGTYEIPLSTTNASFINLNNAGFLTQVAAFKSACKTMDMFGVHEENDGDAVDNSGAEKQSSTEDFSKKTPAKNTRETFCTDGEIITVRDDTRTNQPVYLLSAHRIHGTVMDKKLSNIIFYPNQYKKWKDEINDLIRLCSDGKNHKVLLEVSSCRPDNGREQYIFKGFWR